MANGNEKSEWKIIGADVALTRMLRDIESEIDKWDVLAVYERLCPNCMWKVPSSRLEEQLACTECLPTKKLREWEKSVKSKNPQIRLGKFLKRNKTLKRFKHAYEIESELEDFAKFFRKIVGSDPWSAQRVWGRRVLSGQSFAIIAPTGVGKTVFGTVMALYLAIKKGYTSYIILPTKTLLKQIYMKMKEWEKKLGVNFTIAYYSQMPRSERKEFDERFSKGDFKILITTSQFLIRKLNEIMEAFVKAKGGDVRYRYVDFMFVDDVDSFLRNVKNVDRAMYLLGYMKIKEIKDVLQKIQRFIRGAGSEAKLTDEDWSNIIKARAKCGILVVSSATGRVKGILLRRIFNIIFGFSIGSSKEGIRNVVDAYDDVLLERKEKITNEILIRRAVELIKKIGSGGLVFIARGADSEEILNKLVEELSKEGIKALGVSVESGSEVIAAIEKFASGEVDILIGKASPYGLLVRGLDLPERVRYAIFIKVPKFGVRLERKTNPLYLAFIMRKLAPVVGEDIQDLLREFMINVVWLKQSEIIGIERDLAESLEKKKIDEILKEIEKEIEKEVKEKEEISPQLKIKELTAKLYMILDELLSNKEKLMELLERYGIPFEIREENGEKIISILSADIKSYIQASGRTSRLYAGGITKGLSIVLAQNKSLLEELDRKLSWTVEATFISLSDVNLDELLKEIDRDRKRVIEAREGKIPATEHLQTCLFIVESPTKARTIASFFGRPTRRVLPGAVVYEIIIGNYLASLIATLGHITDIITHRFYPEIGMEKRNGRLIPRIKNYRVSELEWPYGIIVLERKNGNNGISKRFKFVPIFGPKITCGKCGYSFIPYITVDKVLSEKAQERKLFRVKKILDSIPLSTTAKTIGGLQRTIIPIKCPRCGESEILYDKHVIIEALRTLALESEVVLIGTDPDIEGEKIAWDVAILLKPFAKKIKRIEFHEVTRAAIEKALANPRTINMDLVKGQFIRRIEDRWIGFYLSEELQKLLGERNLSAGRVQSPVLSWIVERYNLWKQKERWTSIKVKGFEVRIKGELKVDKIIVEKVEREERKIIPPSPFVTDSLMIYSSILYGLGADETMKLAQKLFELGLITYIRTDSTRVSDAGLYVAKRLIIENFSSELYSPRRWSKGEEGAHECIRPTRPLTLADLKESLERGEIILTEELPAQAFNLYDLIVRVFMASQMKEAIGDMLRVKLRIKLKEPIDGKTEIEEEIYGLRRLKFGGFARAFTRRMSDVFLPRRIPEFEEGETISADKIKIEYLDLPKGRLLTEGEIVRMMKERGIGRPSTYAPIIEKLFDRKYIRKIRGSYIVPRERGIIVNNIINRLHSDMVSEERTKKVLEKIDEVVNKARDYTELLYEIMEEVLSEMERMRREKLPQEVIAEITKYQKLLERRIAIVG